MLTLSVEEREMVHAILFPSHIQYKGSLPLIVRDAREDAAWLALQDYALNNPMRALRLIRHIARQEESANVEDLLSGPMETLLSRANEELRTFILNESTMDMQLLNMAWAAWRGPEDDPFFLQLVALKPGWAQT